jgi:spore coat protein CotH
MMKFAFNRRLAIACAAFLIGVGSWIGPASVARAASQDDLDTTRDARLEVFPVDSNVNIKDASAASFWLIFVLIGVVGIGPVFMDAKRKNLE